MSDSDSREVEMVDVTDDQRAFGIDGVEHPGSAKRGQQSQGHADDAHMTDRGLPKFDDHLKAFDDSRNTGAKQKLSEKEKTSEERGFSRERGDSGNQELVGKQNPSEEKNLSGEPGTRDRQAGKTTSNGHHASTPLPSVEADDPASSSVYKRRADSPAAENRHKGTLTVSPRRERHASASKHHTQAESIKLHKDIARLSEVLQEVSPQAAQRVLRENWRTFIFEHYNEDHISFVLRAGLKNSNFHVLDRVLKDDNVFREPFVVAASLRPEVRKQVLRFATTIELLENVPESKLDKVLAERVKTAPARELINWLANADRLGYKPDDILGDDESVTPNIPSRLASQGVVDLTDETVEAERHNPDLAMAHRDPLLAEQDPKAAAATYVDAPRLQQPAPRPRPARPLSCDECHAQFANYSGYNYHIAKKVCRKQPPPDGYKWYCDNCIQGFTTKQGREYHTIKGVCRGDDIVPATSPSAQLQHRSTTNTRSQLPPRTALPPSRPVLSTELPQNSVPSSPQTKQTPYAVQAQQPPQGQQPSQSQQNPQQSRPDQPQESQFEIAIPSLSKSRTQVAVPPLPPLHTPTVSTATPPTRKQLPPSDIRSSPSELPVHKLAELNRQLADADERYAQAQADIPPEWSEEAKNAKLISLKNANASRKSQIRKSFGVTLRMREKDKIARRSMASSSPGPTTLGRPRMEVYRPDIRASSHSSPAGIPAHVSAPTTGFSPVNAPPRTVPGPQSSQAAFAPPPKSSQYRLPPANTPRDSQPNTLPQPREPPPRTSANSGFGILRSGPNTLPPLHQYLGPYGPNPNKRRHESIEHERRPPSAGAGRNGYYLGNMANPTSDDQPRSRPSSQHQTYSPGLEMVEVGSEDAAAKLGKKRSTEAVQPKEFVSPYMRAGSGPTSRPTSSGGRDGAPAAADESRRRSNTKESPITVDSSEESPPPRAGRAVAKGTSNDSTDSMEDEGKSSSEDGTKKRGFMAKRGGRH